MGSEQEYKHGFRTRI